MGDDELIGGGGTGDVAWETLDGDLVLVDGQLSGVGTDTLSTVETVELVGGAGNNVLDAFRLFGDVILRGRVATTLCWLVPGPTCWTAVTERPAGSGARGGCCSGWRWHRFPGGGAGNDLFQGQGKRIDWPVDPVTTRFRAVMG
ncbi:MAG: hypothetical protein CM1200mP2_41130 [Planctomycetaceae bacterium]|nr:MAG: hypothetical protein CM1200mP2_41130 [Planctomycetaceae bacterium]